MNHEKMWNEMKTLYETDLANLESKGKKGGNAWFNVSVVVDKMNKLELLEQAKDMNAQVK